MTPATCATPPRGVGFHQQHRYPTPMTPTPQKPHWPTPITDRPPTEADGDINGNVQYLTNTYGYWAYCSWESAAEDRDPWLHTSQWEPRVTREEALEALDALSEYSTSSAIDSIEEVLRTYITQTAP